jgi:hypothetical protein
MQLGMAAQTASWHHRLRATCVKMWQGCMHGCITERGWHAARMGQGCKHAQVIWKEVCCPPAVDGLARAVEDAAQHVPGHRRPQHLQ